MPQHTTIPLAKIKVNEQARKHFDEAELNALAGNIREHGLLVPLLVRRCGELYDLIAGERRLRALKLIGTPEAHAIVIDGDAETEVVQWIENAHRADLTAFEKANALLGIKKKKGWNNKEIAAHLHMDASMPTKLLSIFDTVPAVQEAAAAGKIGPTSWYQISLVETGAQPELLGMYLAGMPRDQIAEVRKKRNSPDAPRAQKVRCQLPSGVCVVVSGEGVTLEDSIEALTQAVKEMKRAKDLGYTAKTFAAAMKDKSAAG